MVIFQIKKIRQAESLGRLLSETRCQRHLTVEEAARRLKLAVRYLKALETGRFQDLPGEIYTKNFLKKYAWLLDLEPSALLKKYAEERKYFSLHKKLNRSFVNFLKIRPFLNTPRLLRQALFLTVVAILLIYLSVETKGILSAPLLEIESPADGSALTESPLTIKGQTAPEAKLQINGEKILSDARGFFEEKIALHEGLNVITITAAKRHGRTAAAVRNVIYNP